MDWILFLELLNTILFTFFAIDSMQDDKPIKATIFAVLALTSCAVVIEKLIHA